MSKIALLADTHFGVHQSHTAFADDLSRFFDKVFFPYLDAHPEIKRVAHLGDLVDSRRGISFQALHRIREDLFEPLLERNMPFDIVPGNHDCPYKNSLEHNAVHELNQLIHISFPEEGGWIADNVIMVPWICDENREDILKRLHVCPKNTAIFGHFELNGYKMHGGTVCEAGMDDAILQKFKMVVSGHFHEPSTKGNVNYLGAPCQYTWSDCGGWRGFGIFDTETFGLTKVQNPNVIFMTVGYDENTDHKCFDIFHGRFVKVIVKSKKSQMLLDSFIKNIQEAGAISVKIIENEIDLSASDIEIQENYEEAPTQIFDDYLRSMQDSCGLNKERVGRILKETYSESLTVE